MALFQRMPQASNPKSFYTTGLTKTILIVGLGNPGKEYTGTRHNIGFECIEALAAQMEFPAWTIKHDLKCELTQATIQDSRVILIKPTTFMNLSGEAVQAVTHFYKVPDGQIVVVHDELDIEFGMIRSRMGGSDAGHNGIKSVIEHMGEGFGRVRIGIGPKQPTEIDSADFVLAKFTEDEQKQLPSLKKEVSAVLSEFVYGGGQLPTDTRSFII
ncbi:MAG TPA: aminoacyl-tRNA hydrolase [Candidatus Binatia bacterium]|nr:aminoacyl-tRNA hydrolase [Candidatus Binatia bacterium]